MTRADTPDDPETVAESETLQPSEATDADELATDPLEDGVEPPEGWSGADRYGTTAAEEHEDRALEYRLAEERPEQALADTAARPFADRTLDQLDDSVDHEYATAEPATGEGRLIAGEELDTPEQRALQNEA